MSWGMWVTSSGIFLSKYQRGNGLPHETFSAKLCASKFSKYFAIVENRIIFTCKWCWWCRRCYKRAFIPTWKGWHCRWCRLVPQPRLRYWNTKNWWLHSVVIFWVTWNICFITPWVSWWSVFSTATASSPHGRWYTFIIIMWIISEIDKNCFSFCGASFLTPVLFGFLKIPSLFPFIVSE